MSLNPFELMEKYPEVFEHAFDVSYPPGWGELVEQMVRSLSKGCRVSQIKEKFGQLRVYADNCNPMDELEIAHAERKSGEICDTCGKAPVTARKQNWLSYACEKHQVLE